MIVIPCKRTLETSEYIFKCVKSATMFLPKERIAVIDSDSDDTSYLDELRMLYPSIITLAIKNKNYWHGAYWIAYRYFPTEKFYYLIHDSCEFIGHPDEEDLNSRELTVFSKHCDTYQEGFAVNWASEQLKKTKYGYINGYPNCQWHYFSAQFFIKNSLMTKLYEKGFHNVLPTDKFTADITNRLWGMVLHQEGYSDPVALCDPYRRDIVTDAKWFRKTLLDRQ